MAAFMIQVVLSRFREDLLPVLALLADNATFPGGTQVSVIIYNKGGDDLSEILTSAVSAKRRTSEKSIYDKVHTLITNSSNFRVTNIDNLGREADTYLHHIVENHTQLADVTVFLPASCMNDIKVEHTKQLLHRVNSTKDTVLAGQWIVPSVRGRLGAFMIKNWTGTDSNNAKTMSEVGAAAVACQPASRRPYSQWYDHYFPGIKTHVVCYYSMLAVSAAHVTRQPVSYYQQFLDEVRVHVNPETGHYMERSWEAVFFPLPDACLFAAKPIQQAPASQLKQEAENKKMQSSSFSQLLQLMQKKPAAAPSPAPAPAPALAGADVETREETEEDTLGKRKRVGDSDRDKK